MAVDMPSGPEGHKRPERAPEISFRTFATRPIGAIVPKVTRLAFQKQGLAVGQLLADWPSIVGPTLANVTVPRRFAAGTLTLGCAGPVALELQHLAGPLIERINAHLGRAWIQRLRFVQEASKRQDSGVAPQVSVKPVAVPDFPESPLRDALASLGGRVRMDRP